MKQTSIAIHAAAPAKPAVGAPCNGCGVCCASEPCPLGMVVLCQFKGACRALLWQAERCRYVCGLVDRPADYLSWLPDKLSGWAGRLAARRIAAGQGCDASIEVVDEPE
ncbi:MAG: hypothetical protein WC073_01985 [Sterolibacterium sp.]